jgi:hypothetical protein
MEKEALAKFIDTMTGLLNSAKDFTLEQAPEVMREIVVYHTALYALGVLIGLVLIAAGTYCLRRAFKEEQEIWLALGALPALFGPLFLVFCLPDLLKVTLAPKLFLIEYFAGLVK